MARNLCDSERERGRGMRFDPRERSVEEEFQATQWGALLARDRAVGIYPDVHDFVLRPTRMAGLDELCVRFSDGNSMRQETSATPSGVGSMKAPIAETVFVAQRGA